ncbi:MAG: SDR family NAD(P)-dependent oxidoreductase [Planctomycetota bacterium]|nr:SDR family NAD(P)-dependent oxidoreductase [Planctomycetota bacterium]
MGSHILVTGGAGFIGSHLCQRLLERGDEVICLDAFTDDYDPALKHANIESYLSSDGFELIKGDIRDRPLLEQIARTHSIDAVIHLAAKAGVRSSIRQPALYVDVNLNGTANLLEMARAHSIDHFVFASSSSVYGERTATPFKESDPVDHPVSPYAATKKAGELLCHAFHHLHGINITCLRFFTVYGPRQRPEMAIHLFTRLIEQGLPVPMFGDGSSERDFTYIDDINTGVLAALDRCDGYEIFNLGNHQSIRLDQLIESIATTCGQPYTIDPHPFQSGDVSKTCACIEKSRSKLGFEPTISIEQGLKLFHDWYSSQDQKSNG